MTPGSGRFLRDNAFLVAAAALPLAVVGFFLLSTAVPRWTVPPPAYDLVLWVEAYDSRPAKVVWNYAVRDGKVEAVIRDTPNNVEYRLAGKLFLFHHETMAVSQISVDLPDRYEASDLPLTVDVAALASRRVISEARAPDGYQLENRSRNGSGLVSELFGMRRYGSRPVLTNKGRVVPIELPSADRYGAAVRAVGWLDEGRR